MACRSLCAALIIFAVACASCCHAQTTKHTFYTFCFWDAFARWRPAPHNFTVSDIPAELCDAVIYSHVTIDNNTGSVKLTEKELQLDPEAKAYSKSGMYNPIWMLPPHRAFREMSELKKRNPKLKLLLAIGGPHETIDRYWQFIPQMHLWRDMVISIAQWVKTYGFDGIVLDFFSGSRTAHDREWKWETAKLIDPFIWEIRQRFKQYLPNWHIILTLPAFDSSNHYLFDINRLSQQVNFFFVKSSDCLEFPQLARLNVSTTMDMSDIDRIELMVKRGAERTRIVLEVPLSGRTYSVTSTGSGRRTLFAGPAGKYTKQQGFLSSFEVCDHLLSGWQQWRSSPDSCPYLKDDEDYVTYEDEESIRNKASMIIGRKFRGAVVRSVDLDDCNSKCTGKSNLVKMLRSSFDTAAPDKDYPYNPPTASWWDEDIFKLMPTTAPPPKETTTKPPEVPTRTHNKEPASTMIPTTGQSVASSITVPASNDPRMIPSTTEKVPPAVRTSTPTIGEEVTAKTAQLPSKSSTLAATEAVTSSVTAPASKDPGMVPSTPEKVPPAIKTTDTTIEEEVTVTPAQLPSTLSTLAATEAASSFVTAPASEDPRMGPGTTMNVPRAIKTTTPAISEEVTVTPAQLPSKSSTLAVKEAASSTVSVPSSNGPRMVPSTTEKVPPAVKTSTPAIDEEVTMTPAQLPSELSTLAATEAATKKSTDEICREDNENALMPHESDCTKYYHCANSKPHLQKCARGTVFDIERQICNWPAMTNRPECKEWKENRRKRMAGRLTSL
ncbi:uncharacterized protein LOC119183008 isoform X1 [Rhipicephalus microplus]|uniref:uncharacterized protein LOC119183008 isoform X1 n=1 Tax=Rhipicephalus microplus TaxID=6941 RepID=UPI003F6C1626